MTEQELDDILDRLDAGYRRRREMALMTAQIEIKTIEREYCAYYDGAYDAVKAIKTAMQKERKENAAD